MGSRIYRILRELQTQIESQRSNEGIRDNIQLSRKHQRAVAGNPDNDPSLSSPHVESATTACLKTHPKCRRDAQNHLKPICGIRSKFHLLVNKPANKFLRVIHSPSKLALAHAAILKLLLYGGPWWCCDISLAPCHDLSPLKHSPVYKSHASGSQQFLVFPLSESHP